MSVPKHQPRSRTPLVALAAAGLLALAACSGQAASTSGAPPAAVAGVEAKSAAAAAGDLAAQSAAAPGSPAAPSEGQKVVKNAALTLTVTSVEQSAASIRAIAVGAGGQVTAENLTTGSGGPPVPASAPRRPGSFGTVTLDVPADGLDGVLDQVGKLGTVTARTASSKDVTATYVDTESRISTKKASIDRVRALMAQAKDVAQIVELEGQLAQRESDLESLQATLESLKKHVALSTVTVTLSTDPAPTAEDNGGFLGGLRSGWAAFLSAGNGLLTALGALLPFLLVLALVGVPLLRWWRRRRTARSARSAGSTGSTPAGLAPFGPMPSPAQVGAPEAARAAGDPGSPSGAPGTQ